MYRSFGSLDEIPAPVRARLERDILQATVDEAWASTAAFWRDRDPSEVDKSEADPKHKMALVFRAYLGKASR